MGFEPASVRASMGAFVTLSNINISATSGLVTMKFYQKRHWDRGEAVLGFEPDRIRTLVSMATGSPDRVIIGKLVLPLILDCFSSEPFHTCR